MEERGKEGDEEVWFFFDGGADENIANVWEYCTWGLMTWLKIYHDEKNYISYVQLYMSVEVDHSNQEYHSEECTPLPSHNSSLILHTLT